MRALAIAAGAAFGLWLAFFAGACGPHYPEKPRQGEATSVVWRDFLREPKHDPPDVEWVAGQTCPYGMTPPALVYGGICVAGLDWDDANLCVIVWEGTFHDSAFAHELTHHHLWLSTGDPDVNHSGTIWETVVPAANDALAARGL